VSLEGLGAGLLKVPDRIQKAEKDGERSDAGPSGNIDKNRGGGGGGGMKLLSQEGIKVSDSFLQGRAGSGREQGKERMGYWHSFLLTRNKED